MMSLEKILVKITTPGNTLLLNGVSAGEEQEYTTTSDAAVPGLISLLRETLAPSRFKENYFENLLRTDVPIQMRGGGKGLSIDQFHSGDPTHHWGSENMHRG